MPLHVWLPRAHPMAPAPVSALMSGVMIKAAIYALVRVLVDWVGVAAGVARRAGARRSARCRPSAASTYALFQHDLKRLLALHSIENIGIIVLGLGACLVLRARGAETWAAFALGAALLHTLNHAIFKALLFLGAGAFERAVGSLELDRLGGLLRRMPWTGVAFLVGAMAIAGLPPLNGFASEWLTLQALLHVRAYGHVADGTAGAIALAALAATAALAVFCFVKVVGLVLLGPARRDGAAEAEESPLAMRLAVGFLARGLRRARARARPALPAAGRARAVARGRAGRRRPRPAREPARCARSGSRSRSPRSPARSSGCAARRSAAPAPSWACGQEVVPRLGWTSAGFTKPLRLVLEVVLRPRREIEVRTAGGVVQEVSYSGSVPQPIDEHLYRAGGAARARRPRRTRGGCRAAGSATTSRTSRRSCSSLLAAARIGAIG